METKETSRTKGLKEYNSGIQKSLLFQESWRDESVMEGRRQGLKNHPAYVGVSIHCKMKSGVERNNMGFAL